MKPDTRFNLSWKSCLPAAIFWLAGAAHAALPTLSTPPAFNGTEDTSVNITLADLRTATNAADSDGTAVNFRIVAVSSGNLSVAAGSDFTSGSINWTPAANANGLEQAFTVRALSGGELSTNTVQVSVQVAAVNDAPSITGNITSSLNDAGGGEGATTFLSGLTIDDVENNNVTVVILIPKTAEDIADILIPDATRTEQGPDYVYTYPVTDEATATARLDGARFDPIPNLMSAGSSQTFNIRVEAKDAATGTKSQNLTVNAVDDPVNLVLSLSPPTVPDAVESQPFRVSVTDIDSPPSTVYTLTLTENTGGGSPKGALIIPTGSLTGTAAQLAAGMATVRYLPNPLTGTSTTIGFTCTVSGTNPVISSTATLTVSLVNLAPDISGVTTELIRTDDNSATPRVSPFPSVVISDGNAGQILTVNITQDNPAKGLLWADAGEGTLPAASLTFQGTAAELTQKLRSILFRPASNRVAVGQTEVTTLTISVTDGISSRNNNLTQISAVSVNGAPDVTLDGTQPYVVAGESSGKPFLKVKVDDDDTVANLTVTLKMDNPDKGTLSTLGGFAPVGGSPGTFVFTGTATAATAALAGITYTLTADFPFPANLPGYTVFTIEAKDALQNRGTLVLATTMQNAARNFLVTLREDNALKRPGSLRHAVENAKNNDVITFAFADYPAVVRLDPAQGTLVLTKHLRFKGPGADLLTISGDRTGDGTPDMQLFQVRSTVTMEGLTLSHGTAPNGGAVAVGRLPSQPAAAPGSFTMRYCTIAESRASQWGGAIDVEEGSLVMENCLLKNNATDPAAGRGGGAVSLYTSAACSFTATTFAGNSQRSAAGFGGGALYVENFNPQVIFPVAVTHCTFAGNSDAAAKGTSIHSNVFNSRVTVRGSLFADSEQRNLQVAGSGQIISAGRNLSNDSARTTLIQSGQPQSILLLNQISDKASTNPQLLPLSAAIGGTEVFALSPSSAAIGTTPAVEGPDQRGVLRDASPDTGAVEFSMTERVIINEVQSDPSGGGSAFLEFYIPRDASPVDMSGMSLYVNGELRHTIAPGTPPVQPGFGFIIAESMFAAAGTPVVVSTSPFWNAGQDEQRSVFELRRGAAVLTRADCVNDFFNPVTPAQTFANNSITLAPQFRGAAYVPNSIGRTPPLGPLTSFGGASQSPGLDTGVTPFGRDNARPFAAADTFIVSEDDLISLGVLGNDIDSDGLDKLVLVDVSRLRSVPVGNPPAGDDALATSLLQSGVSIAPSAAPLRGTELWYDPRAPQNHLSAGVSVQDTFFYTIVDIGQGPITAFADAGGGATKITSMAHRLGKPVNNVPTPTEQITISGSGTGAYNATFTATRVDDDTFTIPVPFANDPAVKGSWRTVEPRRDTARSENQVSLTVLGRNDAPTPAADTVATTEEQILRIMGDPDLIATAPVFDTDPNYPAPRVFSNVSLLSNDTDPDDDDNTFKKLRIVGVTQARAVTNYTGTPGAAPVTVTVTGHGLTNGATVLISGYGGHSGYNAYHVVTVVDADTFTIPVPFVDNHTQKGLSGVLTAEGRLSTTSALGAAVSLEIRNSRLETNIIYNPRASAFLNTLSINEPAADSFYYVAQDSHGADAFAKITVSVTGVNDAPVPQNDPGSIAALHELVTGGQTLRDVLAGAQVQYSIPSGTPNRGTVTLTVGGSPFVLTGVPQTNEDTALNIPAAEVLGNDSDIDHLDVLSVTLGAGQNISREGAAVSLAGGGTTVVYNPAASARLNALAREERLMDSIALNIFDGTTTVTAIVAIEVTGRNDKPTALANNATIPEDQLLTLAPPGVLLNDSDPDQDTHIPDNRKVLIPVSDLATTVYGARINASVTPATGDITSFEAATGNPSLTKVNAPAHGLNTGEEIRIGGTAVAAYNGQFPITRVDDNSFAIPLPSAAGAANAGSGTWESLRSLVTYDPRGSVFNGAPVSTVFTLDGLAQGQTYTDTWTYTMFDGSMVFANDDTFRVAADSSEVTLDVSANDVNLSGLTGGLTIVSLGTPSARGTVALGDNNTIIYTPETNFAGDEFFTYTVVDAQGNTDSALVTVRATIEQLNGNLQANRDAFTVAKGQSPLLLVLANDDIVPPTGATISITAISNAPNAGGTAVIEGNGIRYTPAASHPPYPYTETFAYEISGGGTARAIAQVAVTVANRENTLPLRGDNVSVAAGSSNNVLNVLANDNILPGSGLDLAIVSTGPVANGTVSISADKKRLSFTPSSSFLGTGSFTYTATDGLGGTGTATVTYTVGGLTTNNDFFTVSSATATPATLDVLANDRVLGSPGNISLKAMAAVNTPAGTLNAVISGAQTLSFTPVVNQTGEQIFTYTIQDGTGREATGSVTVFVSGPGLRANSDFFTIQVGAVETELKVMLNDVEIPDTGLPRSIAAIGTGADAPDKGGSATPTASGDAILYTPAPNFTGEERFTYTLTNGDISAVAQVIVRVSDGALLANDDAFSVFKGSPGMRLEVLANDRVLPSSGQSLTITGIGIVQNAPGQQGVVTITEDSSALIYTPNPNATIFPYTESFTYEISDGTARRAQATVRVEVLNRTGAREMETNDDAFTILAGGQNILLAVLANDDIRPAAATGWTITDTGAPNQGGTANVAGSFISYTPRTGFVGTETFAYTVSDGLGGTGTATVTVKVGDISVGDDIFTVLSGSGNTNLDVLANDGIFPDGFPDRAGIPGLTGFTLATAPVVTSNGGTATVSGDHIVYRPAANFTGAETFTYLVKDDSGITFPGKVTVNVEPAGSDRASAVLSVTVTGVNDAPVFVNPAATTTNDRTALHPFANASIIDVDDQQRQRVTLRVTWPAGQGTLTGGFTVISPGVIEFSGRPSEVTAALRGLVFTPVNNRIPVGTTEQTAFAVTLNDGFVTSPVQVSGNVTTVTPVNDPPVLTGTVGGQTLYKAFTLQPFIGTNITDVDNLGAQTLQVTVRIDNAIKGRLTGGFTEQPAGSGVYTLTGTPATVAAALRALVFEATPGERITPAVSETATFTITVNDTFAAPVVDSVTTVTIVHGEQDVILPLTSGGADNSQNGAEFSTGIALSGDTLVVGSPRRDNGGVDTGTVHVYERNAGIGLPWGQVAVLLPADVNAGDFFGYAVAIDGDLMVIGSPFAETTGLPENSGVAWVYLRNPADRNAWIPFTKLAPTVAGTGSNDNFGTAVAVDGTTILVGSPKTTLGGEPGVGRVHVYERNQGGMDNFGIVQTISASDGRNGHNFGWSLALDGNTAVIGAISASRSFATADLELGAAYIFTRPTPAGTWTELKKLSAFADTEARANDHFGASVDIDADTVIVGAPHFDAVVSGNRRVDSGTTFVYDRHSGGANNWGLATKVASPNALPGEFYGTSVAIAGDLALIGGPRENNTASTNGFVDVRRRNASAPSAWGLIDRLVDGPEPVLDRFGQSVALDRFTAAAGSPVDAVNAGSARAYQFLFDQGPRLAVPIADQSAPENQAFSFQVPAGAFGDTNFGVVLTYSATLADGTPLPAAGWLSFNAATRTFTGTPVPANNRDYRLIVRAVNQLGSSVVSNTFAITVPLDPARSLQRLYSEWAAGKFPAATLNNASLEATVWGMQANPDNDSARNLLEMLYNTLPQTREPSPLLVVKNADATVSVTFPRSPSVPLQFIHVEWGDTLAAWQRSSVGYNVFTGIDGKEYVTATIYPDAPRKAIYIRIAGGL